MFSKNSIIFFSILCAIIICCCNTNNHVEAQTINYPAANCGLCNPLALCSCGQYSKSGNPLNKQCTGCPVGYSCGGWNKYGCPAGSFGRGSECTLDRSPEKTTSNYCPFCPAGSYQDQANQVGCKACPAGTEQPATFKKALSDCTACASGYGSPEASAACRICQAGEYANGDCVKCPIGTANPNTLQTSIAACVTCGPGKYAAAGSATCSSCSPGSASSADKTDSCTPCVAGYATAAYGATTCSPCSAGYYATGTSNTQCTPCAAGSATSSQASSSCTPCDPGYAQGLQGKQSCTPCTAGNYATGKSNTQCTPCAAGSATTAQAASSCTPCNPGFVQPLQGEQTCTPCSPGYASAGSRLTCQFCNFGMYANASNSTSCSSCLPSTYADAIATVNCKTTDPGYFADVPGLRSPRICPAGTAMLPSLFGSKSSTDCVRCKAGEWSNTTGATSCQPCPATTASTYIGAADILYCTACAGGEWSLERSTSCSKCPAGTATAVPVSNVSECVRCASGFVAVSPGATQCSQCPGGTKSNPTLTACVPCGNGTWSPPGSAACFNCTVGFFCDRNGCDSRCDSCYDNWGYNIVNASSGCIPCPHNYGPNRNGTACGTLSLSPSAAATESATSSNTSSKGTPSKSLTRSLEFSHNSSSESVSSPKTRTNSPSSDISASNSISESSTVSAAPTRSSSESPSDPTPSPSRPSLSASSNLTITETEVSHTSQLSESNSTSLSGSVSIEQTSSKSISDASPSLTEQKFAPLMPLGAPPEAQAAMRDTTNTASAFAGLMAAPAAMAMTRSVAILSLIGCPEKNPNTDTYWSEDRVPFPASLIPGVGFGTSSGKFHRGGVAAFCVLFLIAGVVGFFNSETVGRPMVNVSNQNEEAEKAKEKEKKKHKHNDEENNNKDNSNNIESFSNDIKNKLTKFAVSRQVPRVVFAATSATLGLWSPQAGFIFSTFAPVDIALSLGPIALIFLFVIYFNIRIRSAVADVHHGIYYTPSFVMMKSNVAKYKFLRKIITPGRAKSILNSRIGRFCFFGEYFWTRPKGFENVDAEKLLSMLGNQLQKFRGPPSLTDFIETANPFEGEKEEQLVVQNLLGDKIKKVKNPQKKEQTKTKFQSKSHTNNSENDNKNAKYFSSSSSGSSSDKNILAKIVLSEADGDEKNKKTKSNDNYETSTTGFVINHDALLTSSSTAATSKVFSDWQQKEEPRIIREKDKDTWSATIAVHYLLVSWILGCTCGFLQGVALANPSLCPVIANVLLAQNLVSFGISLWLRPFVIPLRNFSMIILDGAVAITSVIVVATLLTNDENKFNDPVLRAELEKKSAIALALQYVGTIISLAVCAVMIVSGGTRVILLTVGECAAATHEEMWALRTFNDTEARTLIKLMNDENSNTSSSTSPHFDLPFAPASLSTRAAQKRQDEIEKEEKSKKNNKQGFFSSLFGSFGMKSEKSNKLFNRNNNNDDDEVDDDDEELTDYEEENTEYDPPMLLRECSTISTSFRLPSPALKPATTMIKSAVSPNTISPTSRNSSPKSATKGGSPSTSKKFLFPVSPPSTFRASPKHETQRNISPRQPQDQQHDDDDNDELDRKETARINRKSAGNAKAREEEENLLESLLLPHDRDEVRNDRRKQKAEEERMKAAAILGTVFSPTSPVSKKLSSPQSSFNQNNNNNSNNNLAPSSPKSKSKIMNVSVSDWNQADEINNHDKKTLKSEHQRLSRDDRELLRLQEKYPISIDDIGKIKGGDEKVKSKRQASSSPKNKTK